MNFPSGVILLINTKEIQSLCAITLLCSGNIELYYENVPGSFGIAPGSYQISIHQAQF